MKKRIVAIFIAPILGGILGYLLVDALSNGWFSSRWQRIEAPPVEASRLLALSLDSLWVESPTGAIYYNENSSACQSDCWQEVSGIPTLPVVESDEVTVKYEACAPSPPLSGVLERISECRRTMWVDYTVTFAFRKDGSIYLWQADLYKEWAFVLLFGGICLGALILFIPTLIAILIFGFRERRARRADKSPIIPPATIP